MKKMIAILLSVLTVLCMCACSKDEPRTETKTDRLRTQTEVELAVLVMCRRVDDSVVIHIIVRIAGFKFVDHILPCPFRCHPLSFAILFCLSQSVKAAFPFCGAPP